MTIVNDRLSHRLKGRLKQAEGKHCPYCQAIMGVYGQRGGRTEHLPTRDHIIPLSRLKRYWELKWIAPHMMGKSVDDISNIEIICAKCNSEKGALTHEEFVAVRAGLATRLDKGTGHVTHRINVARRQRET